jgi:hypothetical protein
MASTDTVKNPMPILRTDSAIDGLTSTSIFSSPWTLGHRSDDDLLGNEY